MKNISPRGKTRVALLVRSALTAGALCVPALTYAQQTPLPAGPGAAGLDNLNRQDTLLQKPLRLEQADLQLPGAASRTAGRDSSASFVLKGVKLTGQLPSGRAAVPASELEAVWAPLTGTSLTLNGVRTLAAELTEKLRSRGALLTRVTVPRQTIADGVLTLEVVPGRYGNTTVSGETAVRSSLTERVVSANAPSGDLVTRDSLERLALVMNTIPGVKGQVTLAPGTLHGAADLDVTLTPSGRYGGYAGMDNQGSEYTGRGRLYAGGVVNELLGYGDRLRADVMASEHADMVSGSLDYSLMVNGYGTRAGAGYSRLNYRYSLNDDTRGSLSFSGHSDVWRLYVNHPLILTTTAQVNAGLSADHAQYTDRYPFSISNYVTGEDYGRTGRKSATTLTASVSGRLATLPGGVTGADLSVTQGNMVYRDGVSAYWSGADGRDTHGSFTRLNGQLQHEQALTGPFSLYVRASGQAADKNLDASQKFLLGGPSAVRAADVGEGAVDTGLLMTAELRARRDLPQVSWLSSPFVSAAVFYDQGRGQQYRNNRDSQSGSRLTADNNISLSGAGLSLTMGSEGQGAVTATWAHNTGGNDPVSTGRDDNRFWLSSVFSF